MIEPMEKGFDLDKFKCIHLVGISGIEGFGIFRYLRQRKIPAILHDFASSLEELRENLFSLHDYLSEKEKKAIWEELQKEKANLRLKDRYLEGIEEADLIFVPQSWFRYPQNEPLKKLYGKVPFVQITELYLRFFPGKVVGVTGSSGKSTTSALIYHLLKAKKGVRVWLSGNDRANPPVLHKIDEADKNDILVLEISNRQLIGLKISPHIGVLTTISPTHLDDHASFSEYVEVKKNLIRYQRPSDYAILNLENSYLRDFASETPAQVFWFGLRPRRGKKGAFLEEDKLAFFLPEKQEIMPRKDLPLVGEHNVLNALASALCAYILGLSFAQIASRLKTFKGLKHRLELVGKFNGVEFYNDSQATNPEASQAALEAFADREKIVIAGGKAKPNPEDFREWILSMWDNKVKALLLIGEAKEQIYSIWQEAKQKNKKPAFYVAKCKNLEEAVKRAFSLLTGKEVVLLSPACESFGEFKDYRERGEKFKKLVKEYAGRFHFQSTA
ncbi:UDP-N-acetylmuramoyl-L-alanine--D-glutamate ligase [bacterium]|nr:UDP-N-acetylmuramoyl-L-alanine--D-glutamate ligase [bacterium]